MLRNDMIAIFSTKDEGKSLLISYSSKAISCIKKWNVTELLRSGCCDVIVYAYLKTYNARLMLDFRRNPNELRLLRFIRHFI